MIWRRFQVPASMTLRELHGVIQVAMGWEGIHLFQFMLRAKWFGSLELAARSPDVPLSSFASAKEPASATSTISIVHGSSRYASRAGMRLTLRGPSHLPGWRWILPARGLRWGARLSGSA
jgi:hypothetical protein